MGESRTYVDPDYSAVDPVLSEWVKSHDLRIDCDYNGYVVRSIWWREKVQIWMDSPNSEGYLLINAAERRPDLPSQWGRSLKIRVPTADLHSALEKVWLEVQEWV